MRSAPQDQREEAEKKMKDVGEAYEILSDPEKKEKYDRYTISKIFSLLRPSSPSSPFLLNPSPSLLSPSFVTRSISHAVVGETI
jgi:curved DNA-binding protein CbpA